MKVLLIKVDNDWYIEVMGKHTFMCNGCAFYKMNAKYRYKTCSLPDEFKIKECGPGGIELKCCPFQDTGDRVFKKLIGGI